RQHRRAAQFPGALCPAGVAVHGRPAAGVSTVRAGPRADARECPLDGTGAGCRLFWRQCHRPHAHGPGTRPAGARPAGRFCGCAALRAPGAGGGADQPGVGGVGRVAAGGPAVGHALAGGGRAAAGRRAAAGCAGTGKHCLHPGGA
ncbi:hypothetical protein DIZ40_17090, partial [Legionella pneumophila]